MIDAPQSDSRHAVLVELRQHGSRTADQLVEATGLSKTAVRAHLVRMERDGAIARVAYESDGPGRPPAAFELTDEGATLFPSDDSLLLSSLMRFLEKSENKVDVAAFFSQMWSDRMHELLEALGVTDVSESDLDARVNAIQATLTSRNFMPVIDRESCSDGSQVVRIRECNCPFPAAAGASETPCRFEIDFLSQVLGTRPRSVSFATSRKDSCTFEFVIKK